MATVLGKVGSDKEFIKNNHIGGISSASQVLPEIDKVKKKLSESKTNFYKALPAELASEKKKLGELEEKRKSLIASFDEKEAIKRKEIAEKRLRASRGNIANRFAAVLKYVFKQGELIYLKHIQRHSVLAQEAAKIQSQKDKINELVENPNGVFEKRNRPDRSHLNSLEGACKSPEYKGAIGELKVSNLLEKSLNDDFYVLNNVRVVIKPGVPYNGIYRESAQVDHIVAGPTGIFVIETKNWRYAQNPEFNPLEQAGSEGFLTKICLERDLGYSGWINTVVVSVNNNITCDRKKFRYVDVCSLEGLTHYILSKQNHCSKREVEEIVDFLDSS